MKKISLFCIISIFLFSCKSEKKESNLLNDKVELQANLIRSFHEIDSLYKSGINDTASFLQFINESVVFAELYPEDNSAPELLMQAGVVAMRLAQEETHPIERKIYAQRSIDILERFLKVYPEDERAKYCYWWKGIIYGEILEMYPSAENEYRDFLHKFPNDSLATAIRFSLENLGKSAPEILSEIEQ